MCRADARHYLRGPSGEIVCGFLMVRGKYLFYYLLMVRLCCSLCTAFPPLTRVLTHFSALSFDMVLGTCSDPLGSAVSRDHALDSF